MQISQRISLAAMARNGGEGTKVLGGFTSTQAGSSAHPTVADISECLFFSPGDGRIWLQDQRMVLLHTEALGSLRREMIDSLGTERARGLFTRAGYVTPVVTKANSCGTTPAKTMSTLPHMA